VHELTLVAAVRRTSSAPQYRATLIGDRLSALYRGVVVEVEGSDAVRVEEDPSGAGLVIMVGRTVIRLRPGE
jgi:hypothetical protein